VLVGVLATLSVIVSTKVLGKTQFLGASTTFVRAAGFAEQTVAPEHVKKNPYFLVTTQVKSDVNTLPLSHFGDGWLLLRERHVPRRPAPGVEKDGGHLPTQGDRCAASLIFDHDRPY